MKAAIIGAAAQTAAGCTFEDPSGVRYLSFQCLSVLSLDSAPGSGHFPDA